jgi:hypothetical protein
MLEYSDRGVLNGQAGAWGRRNAGVGGRHGDLYQLLIVPTPGKRDEDQDDYADS